MVEVGRLVDPLGSQGGALQVQRLGAVSPLRRDRCRSACIANGRLRYTGEDASRRAPPRVVFRVSFYVLQTSSVLSDVSGTIHFEHLNRIVQREPHTAGQPT